MKLTVNKIRTILKAKFIKKEGLGAWYQERLDICGKCPMNSMNIKKRSYSPRMWKWHVLNFFKPFCSICGCEIKAKASVEIEECSLWEIDKEPKWTSIL